jgi:hypothetical protein
MILSIFHFQSEGWSIFFIEMDANNVNVVDAKAVFTKELTDLKKRLNHGQLHFCHVNPSTLVHAVLKSPLGAFFPNKKLVLQAVLHFLELMYLKRIYEDRDGMLFAPTAADDVVWRVAIADTRYYLSLCGGNIFIHRLPTGVTREYDVAAPKRLERTRVAYTMEYGEGREYDHHKDDDDEDGEHVIELVDEDEYEDEDEGDDAEMAGFLVSDGEEESVAAPSSSEEEEEDVATPQRLRPKRLVMRTPTPNAPAPLASKKRNRGPSDDDDDDPFFEVCVVTGTGIDYKIFARPSTYVTSLYHRASMAIAMPTASFTLTYKDAPIARDEPFRTLRHCGITELTEQPLMMIAVKKA